MSKLFTPLRLRDLTLGNRITVAPMCQYSATDGAANAWHLMHLGSLALSGASMLCIEATAVEPGGRITPGCLGLWDDTTEAALKPVMAAIRQHSPIAMAMQIAHAGRKGSSEIPWKGGQQIALDNGGWLTDGPSALPQKPGELPPHALDLAGIERIKAKFVATARRAMSLGMDAIEIHGAHGYLLHEFLSPISNQRTDQYGGSLENRMRLAIEVFEAVRRVVPEGKPVGIKVSASDWVEGGWDLRQTIELAKALQERGVDWVTASSGGISPLQKIPVTPGYQVPFAAGIKAATGLPVFSIGLITEPRQAEDILVSGQADVVSLARGMLYDPRWGWHAAAALGAEVQAPPQYWRAPPYEHKNIFGDTRYGGR
jgi:2,4-dienoyl-CoA reductase-like NADH-dependent reductase (Old Yellow Enzyme family)